MLFIFISCNDNLKCKYKNISLIWVTKITENHFAHMRSHWKYNLYFITHVSICILFLPEQLKCCTKLTQQFLCHSLLQFYQHSLPSTYWWLMMSKEKEGCVVLSFTFPLGHHFQHNTGNYVRKHMMGFLGLLCLFEHHCLSLRIIVRTCVHFLYAVYVHNALPIGSALKLASKSRSTEWFSHSPQKYLHFLTL